MRLGIRGFVFATVLSSAFIGHAQARRDTIRENINYQWATQGFESGEKLTGRYHYIGLHANQLLRQLLGSAGGVDNPFTLTYAFNSVATGAGMSFGIGLNFQNTEDNDAFAGTTRTTNANNVAFRVGYEVKKPIGKRWIVGYGFDLFTQLGKSTTTSTFPGVPDNEVTSKTNGIGVGPRFSLIFNVSEKIYLGTESTLSFIASKTTSSVSPGPTMNVIKDRSLKLGVPSALFLILRF